VTDIKQAQHALRMVEAQLRDADLRKDEFIGILAHELRGPLSPIRNAVHMLKLMASGEPKLHQVGDILDRQVIAIARLLDDLLDLSRVKRGKLSLNTEPVEMLSVINQAVEWNRAVIELKGQHLIVTPPPTPIFVNGDPVRLVQVVSNLLGNAAKFTDAGGSIRVSAETADEQATVRVRDTGRGLKASELNNIFDLFYQLERTVDRSARGLGIGLSLVRRLVEMHGGRVEAFSQGPGCGSEFVFRLPLLSATDVSRAASTSEIDKARESVLDHALEATFPASDPVAVTQPGGGWPLPLRSGR
jgi:signal transduction histidine kinase